VSTCVSIQLRPSADIVLKKVVRLQYLPLAQAQCTVPQPPLRYVLFFCLWDMGYQKEEIRSFVFINTKSDHLTIITLIYANNLTISYWDWSWLTVGELSIKPLVWSRALTAAREKTYIHTTLIWTFCVLVTQKMCL